MKPMRLLTTIVLAGVVGVTAVACRSTPQNLAVGDCIDVPTDASISTIPKRPCTGPHAGEVYFLFDAPGSGAYPSDSDWEQVIYPVCDPAFKDFTGTPVEERTDIDYQYFVPTKDSWASGDHGVTCFIVSIDGSPLGRSYRTSG
jgi:hypothetical protein